MQKDQIKELAEKVVAGIASEEEMIQYNRICNYYNTGEEGWDENLYGNKNELEEDMKQAIWKQAGIEKPVINLKWIMWIAAASVILVAGTIGLFITKNRPGNQQLAVDLPKKKELIHDIAPGQNGAILTLASGQTILLDSAVNGSLAQQGNVSVIKKNGELVYKREGKTSEVVFNTMTTPIGRQFTLVLADGSRVWLNAASSITFPTAFNGEERVVNVTGEAYFEVAHNSAMPFIVEMGKNRVNVLGTHFNVNAYDDESVVSVTLLEGSVNVNSGNGNKIIKPGQQAQINKDEKISLIRDVDVDNVVAWKNGRISFQGADIGTVMRQMSRWYDVDIVYDHKLDDLFYADMARSTMLSDVLKALELTRNVHFKIEGRKVTVAQ